MRSTLFADPFPHAVSTMFVQRLIDGGLVFTLPLTLLLVSILVLALKKAVDIYQAEVPPVLLKRGIDTIIFLGILSLIIGFTGLVLGLIQAFDAIEAVGTVSPALFAGGLKVALLAPLYSLVIMLCASLLWFVLDRWALRVASA